MIRVYIEDKEKDVVFGFIKDVPSICSQGKTKEEVDKRIEKYFKCFIERN